MTDIAKQDAEALERAKTLGYPDYPAAWAIQRELERAGTEHLDERCSAVVGNGAFLCDCGLVTQEWDRRFAPA